MQLKSQQGCRRCVQPRLEFKEGQWVSCIPFRFPNSIPVYFPYLFFGLSIVFIFLSISLSLFPLYICFPFIIFTADSLPVSLFLPPPPPCPFTLLDFSTTRFHDVMGAYANLQETQIRTQMHANCTYNTDCTLFGNWNQSIRLRFRKKNIRHKILCMYVC